MVYIGFLLLCVVLLGVVGIGYNTYRTRKKNKETFSIPITLAGSDASAIVGMQAHEDIDIYNRKYENKDGIELDPKNYSWFVTRGNSMQYCNINDGDLLFVTKNFKIEQLNSFPEIIVLSKRNPTKEGVQHKLRRAWACCNITDDFNEILKSIMNLGTFDVIKRIPGYDGEEELIKDFFDTRLRLYKENHKEDMESSQDVVISTTFHTDENKVRFSIHPISTIEGIVVGAFPMVHDGRAIEGINTANTSKE